MNDILLDKNDDLLFANGDFVIGGSHIQEVSIILELNKGELKMDTVLGCNLISHKNSVLSSVELKNIIKNNLKRDGKTVNKISVENNQIQIQ